jgi:hypothetical protein
MERPSSEQELVTLHASFLPHIQNPPKRKAIARPPSYSDSFFFMPLSHTQPNDILSEELVPSSATTDIVPAPPAPQNSIQPSSSPHISRCALWTIRSLSFGFHIMLISIFETLFFFLFISKSEDSGIQGTIQNYIDGILSQCAHWSANETQLVNAILTVLIQANQTLASAQTAMQERTAYNSRLEVQAWMYVVGTTACLLTGGLVARLNAIRIPWKRIVLENMIMVSLLGIYEFTFFKTIIYNYRSLTVEELNGNIVGQLQSTCKVLT